jgi:hypothetical protein
MAEPAGDTDLTKGWDAVFAVRYSVLNKAIENAYKIKPDALPTKFSGATKGRLGSSKVDGTWNPWQVTTLGNPKYSRASKNDCGFTSTIVTSRPCLESIQAFRRHSRSSICSGCQPGKEARRLRGCRKRG